MTPPPDLVIYLGPGVGLAILGIIGYVVRQRRKKNAVRPAEDD